MPLLSPILPFNPRFASNPRKSETLAMQYDWHVEQVLNGLHLEHWHRDNHAVMMESVEDETDKRETNRRGY
ncbi:hypothetical protein SERLA73DRAFT_139876, partial [Serpula lacrymans var. lacrymans S7.3]